MRKLLLVLSAVLLSWSMVSAQFVELGFNNPTGIDPNDTEAPYYSDQGVRSVWVTQDLDQDGKPEVVTTDYSNGCRVHVFEYVAAGQLELVWSSPVREADNPNSVPRWARDGDLDGDGYRELIFPVGSRYDGQVQVWEWDGTDNGFGDEPALTLDSSADTLIGLGRWRMDRETATVYDFDGDGYDELITCNENHAVYILGVDGDIPGFGTWNIEGGHPDQVSENRFSTGSWWQSAVVDYDGDGTKEIANHYWNFYGFWSIEPTGEADSYTYPKPEADGRSDHYYEYYYNDGADLVSYMGLATADVDGDGKEEIAGIYYGASPYYYNVGLTALQSSDDGVYVWDNDPVQHAQIAEGQWTLIGNENGSHWGIGAYDFNGNGRDEILLGGSAGYNVVSLEYDGDGDILDPANYNGTVVYAGAEKQFFYVDVYDSVGVMDTIFRESPFVSRMFAGCDLDSDDEMEAVTVYQSVADSITYTYYSYRDTSLAFEKDSTVKIASDKAVNMRVLEWTSTGVEATEYSVITPDDYVLEQNYPNPFNPETTIRFSLPVDKKVSLKIYDILGNEVSTLLDNELLQKNSYEVKWNATTNAGSKVASGVYIATLQFGNFSKSIKMSLLK